MAFVDENPNLSNLPNRPFDGQIFIDYYGVEWIYTANTNSWRNNGKKSSIPVASDNEAGLLDKSIKEVIDSVADRGGGFGLIVKPFLSAVPLNVKPLFQDKIFRKTKTESGTTVYGEKPYNEDSDGQYNLYVENKMAGLVLRLKTGTLKGRQFLVFGNTEGKIFVDGDLTSVKVGDIFELYDPIELNPSGVLTGDIEVVSDSLDISCVSENKEGDLDKDQNCKPSDEVKPSGLQFKIKDKFLNALCVEIPGCKGPKGNKGDKGKSGKDGTGDGPQGEPGDNGDDALFSAKFSGIKVIETDDISDTAVVALEPDPDLGKLYVVKAKIKAPISGTPADQVIASAISRSVTFEEEFFFKINKPSLDPIEADGQIGIPASTAEGANCFIKSDFENDVVIMVCPDGGANEGEAQAGIRWLSDYLLEISQYYRDKLFEAIEQWDQEAKEFITTKDQEARQVICSLAQQLAECEWELPLEYCITLSRGNCSTSEESTSSFPLAGAIFGDDNYPPESNPQIQLVSQAYVLGGEGKQFPETPVVVRMDGKNSSGLEVDVKGEITDPNVTQDLPVGDYLLVWDSGSIRDYDYPHLGSFVGGWLAGPNSVGIAPYGVKVKIRQSDGTENTQNFPVPDILRDTKIKKTGPLGAYCVKIPPNANNFGIAEYFCSIRPFASDPSPTWIEGAFDGYWDPGDNTKFDGTNQVPPPGTQGPAYTQQRSQFDASEVEEAYRKAPLDKKSISFTVDETGGRIYLQCPILGSGRDPQFANREQSKDKCISGDNVIKFRLYRIVNAVTNITVN